MLHFLSQARRGRNRARSPYGRTASTGSGSIRATPPGATTAGMCWSISTTAPAWCCKAFCPRPRAAAVPGSPARRGRDSGQGSCGHPGVLWKTFAPAAVWPFWARGMTRPAFFSPPPKTIRGPPRRNRATMLPRPLFRSRRQGRPAVLDDLLDVSPSPFSGPRESPAPAARQQRIPPRSWRRTRRLPPAKADSQRPG